jgi:hypothetical protein
VKEIAKILADGTNPNLVVTVHGFNNPRRDVLKTYTAAAIAIKEDAAIDKRQGLVCLGYRWPSEKMGSPLCGTWTALAATRSKGSKLCSARARITAPSQAATRLAATARVFFVVFLTEAAEGGWGLWGRAHERGDRDGRQERDRKAQRMIGTRSRMAQFVHRSWPKAM